MFQMKRTNSKTDTLFESIKHSSTRTKHSSPKINIYISIYLSPTPLHYFLFYRLFTILQNALLNYDKPQKLGLCIKSKVTFKLFDF